MLSKIPCQPPFDFKHREIYVLALDYDVPVYCIAFGTLVLGVSITVFGWLIFHMLWFGTLSSSNSIRTLNMQRRFAISLTIQVTHSFSEISKNVYFSQLLWFRWYLPRYWQSYGSSSNGTTTKCWTILFLSHYPFTELDLLLSWYVFTGRIESSLSLNYVIFLKNGGRLL